MELELERPPQTLTLADQVKIRDRIREIITSGVPGARKAMCEAMIKEIVIIADVTVRPIFKLPLADNDEGLALDGPALFGGERAARALPTMVELLKRYSNNSALRDDLRYTRQAVMSPDEDDEPDLGGSRRARSTRRWAVADRLASDGLREVVECYRTGMTARELAEKFAISASSVKRILRWAGARKRRKPPG